MSAGPRLFGRMSILLLRRCESCSSLTVVKSVKCLRLHSNAFGTPEKRSSVIKFEWWLAWQMASAWCKLCGLKAAEATFRSQIAAVQIPVTVKDGRRFVGGLPEQAFRIYENDRPEQLVWFIADDVPLELVIAIDTSASVKADMPAITSAAAELLSTIPSKQPVTVLAFNDQVISIAVRQTEPALRLQALVETGAVGQHGILRRRHTRSSRLRATARKKGTRGIHRWRRSRQPLPRSQRRSGELVKPRRSSIWSAPVERSIVKRFDGKCSV